MSRAQVTLCGRADRERAVRWIAQAPAGTRVTFKESKRSLAMNDKLWAMLTDIASQLTWHGQKLTTNDWKLVFLDALKRELRLVPNINNNGFVNLNRSSSDLSKSEMSDLFEIMHLFAIEHGVILHDPDSPPPLAADKPPAVCPPPSPAGGNLLERT